MGARAALSLTVLLLAWPLPEGAATGQEPAPVLSPGAYTFSLQHQGLERSYLVRVPPAASEGHPLPVVLAFHGGGGNASQFSSSSGLDDLADREGFLSVHPNGTGRVPGRALTWNAGPACCGWARDQAVDDVGFVLALLDDLARRTPLDRSRVYATGHSNGAMMAYRLAAEAADRIAAIAPVAGAMVLEDFRPVAPVPVLHIHSVDDPRALYTGGEGPPFPFTTHTVLHKPVEDVLARWVELNDCPSEPEVTQRKGNERHTAALLVWGPCSSGAPVEHWKLWGAGHGWPETPDRGLRERLIGPSTNVISGAEEVWRFLQRFSREKIEDDG